MPYKRNIIILFILFTQIIWPVEIIMNTYTPNPGYIFIGLHAIAAMIFLFYAIQWEYTNYYLRYVYMSIISVGIAYVSIKLASVKELVSLLNYEIMLAEKSTKIWGALFLFLCIRILLSWNLSNNVIDLDFPFKDGTFLIVEGGDGKKSFFSNYHYYLWKFKRIVTNDCMRYATDIIKLNKFGFSNYGFIPKENDKFFIYGEKLYSPIDGEVFYIKDGINDNVPHSGNYPLGLGNMLVLKQGNYYVLLGHLMKNSLRVYEGQTVKKGDFVARIGLTGYTPRPHLHMHVVWSEDGDYWNGKAVSVKINSKVPRKNTVYKV